MKMIAKFPGNCQACGCKVTVGEEIEYSRGVGARHYTINQCGEAKKRRAVETAAKADTPVLDLTGVVKFLKDAQDRGLKSPKLRVLALDQKSELRVAITKTGIAPGSLSVASDVQGFIGCVRPDGRTTGQLAGDTLLQAYLVQVALDPITAAKQFAALMGRCSFCGKELTDAGSVEVGYGPVCAAHWGLPHSPKGVPVLTKPVVTPVLHQTSETSLSPRSTKHQMLQLAELVGKLKQQEER